MTIADFMAEVDLLVAAYPSVFPTDPQKRTVVAAIWYYHFSHIPKEMFAKAAKYCREHERFLSIASLRESIIQVADVPSAYEIRKQIAARIKEEAYGYKKSRLHPMAGWIYDVLDLDNKPLEDYPFEREYKRAREWWVEKIMKPENVALLTGPPLLKAENPGA